MGREGQEQAAEAWLSGYSGGNRLRRPRALLLGAESTHEGGRVCALAGLQDTSERWLSNMDSRVRPPV